LFVFYAYNLRGKVVDLFCLADGSREPDSNDFTDTNPVKSVLYFGTSCPWMLWKKCRKSVKLNTAGQMCCFYFCTRPLLCDTFLPHKYGIMP